MRVLEPEQVVPGFVFRTLLGQVLDHARRAVLELDNLFRGVDAQLESTTYWYYSI